jgi:hypothetical protein
VGGIDKHFLCHLIRLHAKRARALSGDGSAWRCLVWASGRAQKGIGTERSPADGLIFVARFIAFLLRRMGFGPAPVSRPSLARSGLYIGREGLFCPGHVWPSGPKIVNPVNLEKAAASNFRSGLQSPYAEEFWFYNGQIAARPAEKAYQRRVFRKFLRKSMKNRRKAPAHAGFPHLTDVCSL